MDTSAAQLPGMSNATACAKSAAALFSDARPCMHADGTRCGFLGEYQPSSSSAGELYAFSNFAYTWEFIGAPATADIATVRARASTICSYNMSELVEYNSGLPEPQEFEYLSGYCFSAMYALELLSTGYGFPETDTPITVVEDVNGTEVSWALGSIIYQANALSWTLEPPDDDGGASQDSCVMSLYQD